LPTNGDNLPDGTFLGSCHGCTVTETTLSCSACLDGAGASHPSSIPLANCYEFGNEQGSLVCTAGLEGGSFGTAAAAAAATLPHDEL